MVVVCPNPVRDNILVEAEQSKVSPVRDAILVTRQAEYRDDILFLTGRGMR